MLASRIPIATAPGLLLALATFWLLWMTINMPLDVGAYREAPNVDYWRKIVETDPVPTPDERPPKPVLEIKDTIGPVTTVTDPPAPPIRVKPSPFGKIDFPLPPGPGPGTAGSDTDAMPRVRIEPHYPPPAAARGREGWVLVQFSVTASGAVTDVQVIDADPKGVFERATLDAVRQWRYWPKIVDGEPVDSVGLRTVVHFTLPDR